MTTTTKQETLQEIFNDDEMGILTLYKVGDEVFDTYDEAIEYCYQQEVIYYHTAMEYLMTNDASLKESLELAGELCLEVDSLNSEVLATILYQQELVNSIEEV